MLVRTFMASIRALADDWWVACVTVAILVLFVI
jgi:hypothetical protein